MRIPGRETRPDGAGTNESARVHPGSDCIDRLRDHAQPIRKVVWPSGTEIREWTTCSATYRSGLGVGIEGDSRRIDDRTQNASTLGHVF